MVDINRKVPRFNIVFQLSSNMTEAQGVNISQKGMGFLLAEELVPAEDIPFTARVKGFIFSEKVYLIEGLGNLLYSRPSSRHSGLFYNGFEFSSLTKKSEESLYQLLNDIMTYQAQIEEKDREVEKKSFADFFNYPCEDVFTKTQLFYDYENKVKTSDLKMFSYYLNAPCRSSTSFIENTTGNSVDMLMFGSNNYLGMSSHPDVIKAAADAAYEYGTGNGAGAMVGGTLSIHKRLERALAEFTGKEAVMLFNSGYSANTGVISGLMRPDDVIINDQANHASIFDGCLLSRAKTLVFSHNSIKSLERVLNRAKLKYYGSMIIVDGVYSAGGDLAPIKDIIKVAKKNSCRVIVDEAHGFGVLGKTGIGACEHFKCHREVDVIVGTLSKALGGVGGFAASDVEVIEYLRFYSRSYLFSTNFPPTVAGGLIKALEVLRTDNSLRERLLSNAEFFKKGLLALNFEIGKPEAAIVPIYISDDDILMEMSVELFNRGLFHNVFRYPAVPQGGSMLRFGIMATHSEAEIRQALTIIEEAAHKVKLFDYLEAERSKTVGL